MNEKLAQAIQYRKEENFDEAKRLLDELLADNPQAAEVNYHMAWLHDSMGLEREAIPYYETAIAAGLSRDDLRGALLGLGSTYRCLGNYEKSADTLRRGLIEFPDATEFPVFLAMAEYNLGHSASAVGRLLKLLAEYGNHDGIQAFKRAILFYHDKLDEIW